VVAALFGVELEDPRFIHVGAHAEVHPRWRSDYDTGPEVHIHFVIMLHPMAAPTRQVCSH